MKYLLNTDIILFCLNKKPLKCITSLLKSLPKNSLYISCISYGEIKSVTSRKVPLHLTQEVKDAREMIRSRLRSNIDSWLIKTIGGKDKILTIDQNVWLVFEELISMNGNFEADTLIAAQSLYHKATLITAFSKEFEALGVSVLNPITTDKELITFN